MVQVKQGDTVDVQYTGTLLDGTVFDTSEGRAPLSFEVGTGQVIAGFETAVLGMQVGQVNRVEIPPEDAYGQPREDLIVALPRTQMPEGPPPRVGQTLELHLQGGHVLQAQVVELTDETIVIDANHPLAGQTLVFEIELVKIH